MDDQECGPAGHSAVGVLQRNQQTVDGEIRAVLLLQKGGESGEGGRHLEKVGRRRGEVNTEMKGNFRRPGSLPTQML